MIVSGIAFQGQGRFQVPWHRQGSRQYPLREPGDVTVRDGKWKTQRHAGDFLQNGRGGYSSGRFHDLRRNGATIDPIVQKLRQPHCGNDREREGRSQKKIKNPAARGHCGDAMHYTGKNWARAAPHVLAVSPKRFTGVDATAAGSIGARAATVPSSFMARRHVLAL